jgi:hypothetical protein
VATTFFGVVKRFADLREVDKERLRHWTFARTVADPRPDWTNVDVRQDIDYVVADRTIVYAKC